MAVVKRTFALSQETDTLLRDAQGGGSGVQSLEDLLWSHPSMQQIAERLGVRQPVRCRKMFNKSCTGPRLRQRTLF